MQDKPLQDLYQEDLCKTLLYNTSMNRTNQDPRTIIQKFSNIIPAQEASTPPSFPVNWQHLMGPKTP